MQIHNKLHVLHKIINYQTIIIKQLLLGLRRKESNYTSLSSPWLSHSFPGPSPKLPPSSSTSSATVSRSTTSISILSAPMLEDWELILCDRSSYSPASLLSCAFSSLSSILSDCFSHPAHGTTFSDCRINTLVLSKQNCQISSENCVQQNKSKSE